MKKNVAVIFGSMSSEHDISCISAGNILENIDKKKYNVKKIGIDKNGIWYLYAGSNNKILENKWIEDIENKEKIIDLFGTLKKFDIIFPVLHGKYGEDGTIQGIFEMANVEYVGCKVVGSSICMDKTLCKQIVKLNNIPVVPYISVNKEEFENYSKNQEKLDLLYKQVEEKLGLPLFVKPNKEGSSYGVNKVEKIDDLFNAIKYALKFDKSVLIEKYIGNKIEVECAIIQKGENIISSTPGMIVSSNEIYDFNTKYIDNTSSVKIPADINKNVMNKIKKYSEEIFKMLRCNGLARVDFFVTKDNNIYFNEINTMPGFTSISMYPKMLIHDGYTYNEIIDTLLENC